MGMTRPRVTVVGLGPAGSSLITRETWDLLESSPVVVFRTLRHPAAEQFAHCESYDHLYEGANSFDEVYQAMVDDLCEKAVTNGAVLYVVPGSPSVAERSVELLRECSAIDCVVLSALSFLDLAWVALGIDPLAHGVRLVDGASVGERLRGPGPILVTQCYSREILSALKLSIDTDLLDAEPMVTILHHLGLPEQIVKQVPLNELDRFQEVDHLTSCYLASIRTVGSAAEDLVDFMVTLRTSCPWDQQQTHESLTRHLLEESYELLEALEELTHASEAGNATAAAVAHVEEELGDVLFQVVFHAQIASEGGEFELTAVMDGVREKLTARHPHVFGDLTLESANQVESNWEMLKKKEKGRTSVTEGIPSALPALTRYAKLMKKAYALEGDIPQIDQLAATLSDEVANFDALQSAESLGAVLATAVELGQALGLESESVLRRRCDELTAQIRESEQSRT